MNRFKAYYWRNREACLARSRAWRAKNPDYHRTWRWRKGKKYFVAYREKTRERQRAYHREWRKRNPEKLRAYVQKWREKHRNRVRAYAREYQRKRRARLRRAG